jgi:hypothetical protein
MKRADPATSCIHLDKVNNNSVTLFTASLAVSSSCSESRLSHEKNHQGKNKCNRTRGEMTLGHNNRELSTNIPLDAF